MNFDDFLEELRKWLQSINDSKKVDDIILDGKYFSYDKSTNSYSINEENIEQFKDVDYLFVGDNPGENEKDHRAFFYVELTDGWIEKHKSTAGYKFYKFTKRLSEDDKKRIMTFNKCLFFTTETDDLEQTQVNDSEIFVVSFFDIFKKYNANLKIVFMGLTEKIFDSIYKKVYRSNKDIIVTPHPRFSLYKYDGTEIIKKENIKLDNFYQLWENVNLLKNFIDNSPPESTLDGGNLINNDDEDDDGDASSPCVVR